MSGCVKELGTKSKGIKKDGFYIKSINNKEESIAELNNEIKILQILNDFGFKYGPIMKEFKKNEYIKLEYINGQTLSEYIKRKPEFLKDRKKIAQNISRSLHDFYQKNLFHNDLAVTNIMLTSTNEINLIDFGRSNKSGSIYYDFGYLLNSIIKVRTSKSNVKNLSAIFLKISFFLDIANDFFCKKMKKSFAISIFNILREYVYFELYVIKNRNFTRKEKKIFFLSMILVTIMTFPIALLKIMLKKIM
ncbi:protein kinase domain-containing protein [Planococcus plakortidis]|uniref:protein kinase domain-containing protein n=1 Tax=Planococcus plakortidis TaxID=1038856 RepID=UPI003857F8BF